MNLAWAIARLSQQAAAIEALVTSIDATQARWKTSPTDWSILEVVNHLADEEREDFRRRLDLTLHQPEAEWPPIDPAGWVTARKYSARDLGESLADFLRERNASLDWLRSLQAPDLSLGHRHPAISVRMQAGDLLASWTAHDLLHLRQLVELNYGYLSLQAQPYGVRYAGDW